MHGSYDTWQLFFLPVHGSSNFDTLQLYFSTSALLQLWQFAVVFFYQCTTTAMTISSCIFLPVHYYNYDNLQLNFSTTALLQLWHFAAVFFYQCTTTTMNICSCIFLPVLCYTYDNLQLYVSTSALLQLWHLPAYVPTSALLQLRHLWPCNSETVWLFWQCTAAMILSSCILILLKVLMAVNAIQTGCCSSCHR